MNGQSPGKRQMKIKVVSIEGASPSIGSFFMRWLFRLVEIYMLRGATAIITIGANGKGQRLGDIAGGTTVVKLIPFTESSVIFTTSEEGYVPSFTRAQELTDAQVELIQNTLDVNRDQGNTKPADMLVDKLKTHFNLTTDLPNIKFLYTLVKDHSYFMNIR